MKERLDRILVMRSLAPSRERARAYIMEGVVFVNGQREDKPGTFFNLENIKEIEVREDPIPYVSRGGLKLERAIEQFEISVSGMTCLDIGASTGGFTDCLLQNGAAKVYSIDSGTNQLDWRLRSDERVICMEKTNFRYMTPEDIGVSFDFACADVSFISLKKILIPARDMMKSGAHMVCLVKPQFEAGRDQVGKNGVVRDPHVREEVLTDISRFCGENGFSVLGHTDSPILGAKGNHEYLLYLRKE